LGHGRTIPASCELESSKLLVDEKLQVVGDKQCISISDGYHIPITMKEGLAYFTICAPTDHELSSLSHVLLTSDFDWDPTYLTMIYLPKM
jgi:hypothetical protein